MTKELYDVWLDITIEPSQADFNWAAVTGHSSPQASSTTYNYIVIGETEKQAYTKAMEYWQEHHERGARITSHNVHLLAQLQGISLEDRLKVLEVHFRVIK